MTDLVPVTRTIVGDEVLLRRALETAHASGRLLSDPQGIRARQTAGGLWHVTVRLMEPAPKRTISVRLADFDRRHPILGPCLKALAWGLMVVLFIVGAAVAIFEIGYHAIGAATLGKVGGMLVGIAVVIALLYLFARPSGDGHRKGYGYHWTKCK